MGRLKNSLELAKSSGRVLQADKELVLLPVISCVVGLVVVLTFVTPIIAMGQSTSSDGTDTFTYGPVGWILTFIGYVVLAYVGIFFSAAIVHAADERIRGGDPTLGSALRGAASRAGVILPWAIVSATVSTVLRAISERTGIIGRIVIGLIGMAWSLMTFLVLPILVIEGIGVGAAIKRSAELFKRTWGEQVVGNVAISLVAIGAVFAAVPLLILGALVSGPALVLAMVIFLLWCGVVFAVTAAMSTIYRLALYRFATDGVAPPGFDDAVMRAAFTPRKRRF